MSVNVRGGTYTRSDSPFEPGECDVPPLCLLMIMVLLGIIPVFIDYSAFGGFEAYYTGLGCWLLCLFLMYTLFTSETIPSFLWDLSSWGLLVRSSFIFGFKSSLVVCYGSSKSNVEKDVEAATPTLRGWGYSPENHPPMPPAGKSLKPLATWFIVCMFVMLLIVVVEG